MRIVLAMIAAVMLLSACAGSHVYRPAASEGEIGYTETRLTEKLRRVTFRGQRSTSAAEVRDYALLRAAEVTLQNGYDWFEILSSDSETLERERLSAATEVAPARQVTRSCGLLGCTSTVHTGYAGVQVGTTRTDSYHVSSIEFRMGQGEPDDPDRVYDAAQLASNIRESRLGQA